MEFQFGRMKTFCRWLVVTVNKQWEHTECHETIHLKLVTFILFLFNHSGKKKNPLLEEFPIVLFFHQPKNRAEQCFTPSHKIHVACHFDLFPFSSSFSLYLVCAWQGVLFWKLTGKFILLFKNTLFHTFCNIFAQFLILINFLWKSHM